MRGLVRAVAATAGAMCLAASPVAAQDSPKAKPVAAVDADRVLAEADAAERGGKFEKALELYLKAYTAGRNDADIRDRIRHCFRNVAQADRQRDPAFQQFVHSLTPSDALALYSEAVEKIHKLYAERDRATIDKLFAAGLDELDRALGDPAFRAAHLPDVPEQKVFKFRQLLRDGWRAKLPTTARELAHTARELVSAANKTLGLRNGSVVVMELLCGACGGLDEYSTYITPAGPLAMLASPIVEMAAYGLLVRLDAKGLVIDGLIPGSWAAVHTKLAKGDVAVRVNGRPMAGASAANLLDALRNPSPTGHELELTPIAMEMDPRTVRLPTPLPTVYGADMLSSKDGVGYLRLAGFQEQTPRELDDAILELKARGMKALVIDLRGNPGGLFTSALAVAKLFLPSGLIASTLGQSPEFANRLFSSDSGMAAYDVPIVLLVDTKTMSAAEILAAGLKDNHRATLVGLPTFGKGFVQSPVRLHTLDGTDDPAAVNKSGVLILSVASVLGPRGTPLNGTGVTPHVTEPNADRQLAIALRKATELAGGPPMPMIMR